QVEAAHNRGDNERAIALLHDVLALEPGNVMALERLGSAEFLSGHFSEALSAWERVLPLETNPSEILALRQYIDQAKANNKASLPGGLSLPPQARPAPSAAKKTHASAKIAVPAKGMGDPRDVARLYQKGVEFYARGEYLQATAMFMRVLQIDPNNGPARKAIERIERAQKQ
ncbi:MAG: hypothetical protein KGJ45_11365, partial [Elusimicrobia bacterium]|nr:hypothetical protein [Elusimicrobiota bacterium]